MQATWCDEANPLVGLRPALPAYTCKVETVI